MNTTPTKKLIFSDGTTLSQVSSLLSKRGPKAFINLHRQLKIMDEDQDAALTFPQFKKAFQDYRIDLTQDQFEEIFYQQGKGTLSIPHLTNSLLLPFDSNASYLLQHIFSALDKD